MKIFYTSNFKRCLKNPYKRLKLSSYKLRHGTSTGFEDDYKIKTSDITSDLFLRDTSPQEGYYKVCGIPYKETGVQLNLEVPSIDASFYTGDGSYYYQVIIFYYQDITSSSPDQLNPAFILFESYGGGVFDGLILPTLKNIITIPDLNGYKCELMLETTDIVEFFENNTGAGYYKTSLFGSDTEYASREIVELDSITETGENPLELEDLGSKYLETQVIDKYGLKLY